MSLYLLSAPSGAGKTTFCMALAEHARSMGRRVTGILSLPVWENGEKVGILAQDLRNGETHLLAVSSRFPRPGFSMPLGNWLFSPETLAWGNDLLASSLPTDLFIVDELGPLELIRGEGWVNALTMLSQPRYTIGIAVVRPSLVEFAQKFFPDASILSILNQNNAMRQLLSLF